ncbi:S-layer homology domain-containing protein [Paenibacillus aurantiacus]|uniref:S-layer homology domain-containing protein n=1 Tax=Paenibacillus aurantiacus TaxID=1936118 RepID=A0ABV5KRZ3_9BACL
MKKRALTLTLIFLLITCFSVTGLSFAAASVLTANYKDGVITVAGSSYTSGTNYTLRIVDTVNSNIKAMGQATADVNGNIAANITTGTLSTLSNYVVYLNKPNGTLEGSVRLDGSSNSVTYNVSIQSSVGGMVQTGTSGKYVDGSTIALVAVSSNGYVFDSWTSSAGGTFANATSDSTTFITPKSDVVITANFKLITDTAAPGEVTETSVFAGDGQLTLTWTDPADADFEHVVISGTDVTTQTLAKGVGSTVFAGLRNGTEYTLTIKAVDATGNASRGVSISGTPTALAAPVQSVTISKSSTTLTVGGTEQLTLTVTLDNATNKNVVWTVVSGSDIASVSAAGLVTAKSAGTAVVRATSAADSSLYTECTVTVNATSSGNGGTGNTGGSGGNGGTGNTGGSGGNGGTGDSGTNEDTIVVINKGNNITAVTTIDAKSDASSGAIASVTLEQVAKAVQELNSQGGKKKIIEFKVNASNGTQSISISIPTVALSLASQNGVEGLQISTSNTTIRLDQDALESIIKEAGTNVVISISNLNTSTLSDEAKKAIGSKPAIDLSVTSGDKGITIVDGKITVSIPYTPNDNENKNSLIIYSIDETSKLEVVTNGKYDSASDKVTFTTDEMGQFAIGYNKVGFKDVANNVWYSDAVDFVAARGITTGLDDGKFDPNGNLTRGQFLTMVMRAFEMKADDSSSENFSDAGNTYYTGYLAAAKKLGVTNGVGNNKFAPEKEINRQEMVTLLYNILKQMDVLPTALDQQNLGDFKDADQIAPWADEAMTFFVNLGIINGSGQSINPAASTNRAQMSQVLYQLFMDK